MTSAHSLTNYTHFQFLLPCCGGVPRSTYRPTVYPQLPHHCHQTVMPISVHSFFQASPAPRGEFVPQHWAGFAPWRDRHHAPWGICPIHQLPVRRWGARRLDCSKVITLALEALSFLDQLPSFTQVAYYRTSVPNSMLFFAR